MERKDYFSAQSKTYAAFRPTYPDALYDFIFMHLKEKQVAWDCGTGNGQVASHLAKHFENVYATDISAEQINEAVPHRNVHYSVVKAEQTSFPENEFDLITVGQAIHWFDLEAFYLEAVRTGKQSSLLAAWGYALLSINPSIDKLFLDFYFNTVGPYWDPARKIVEQEYTTLHFPFKIIPAPKFAITTRWTRGQFEGYLRSWSATRKFLNAKGYDPVDAFSEELRNVWKDDEPMQVSFPLFLKLGIIK